MNTSNGISSGLVAVAWVPDDVIVKLRSGASVLTVVLYVGG